MIRERGERGWAGIRDNKRKIRGEMGGGAMTGNNKRKTGDDR